MTIQSYTPEVLADSSGQWAGNGLRFAKREHAEAWVEGLSRRWYLVTATRVVPSSDPPNYRLTDAGELEALWPPTVSA